MTTTMTPREFESLRTSIGSVEEVAEAMEVGRVTVYRWETGKREIPGPARVLIRILAERAAAELAAEQAQVRKSTRARGTKA